MCLSPLQISAKKTTSAEMAPFWSGYSLARLFYQKGAEIAMTNEELVEKIQQGERDLLSELWEQVRRYPYAIASRQCDFMGGTARVIGSESLELDDLMQSAYVAMLEAVETFDATQGASFISYLTYYLKKQFAKTKANASGWSWSAYKRSETEKLLLKQCENAGLPPPELKVHLGVSSLNASIGDGDDGDPTELGDFVADPSDAYADVEDAIYQQQLHDKLDEAMAVLTPSQRQTIEAVYYRGLSQENTAAELGVSRQYCSRIEQAAMQRLRQHDIRNKLEEFVDFRTPFYMHVGVQSFQNTGSSAVERIVEMRERFRDQSWWMVDGDACVQKSLERVAAGRAKMQKD